MLDPGWGSEVQSRGFFSLVALIRPQTLGCQNKGKGTGEAQPLRGVCLSPECVAESGLELAFGLDFPVGARKKSGFKGQGP